MVGGGFLRPLTNNNSLVRWRGTLGALRYRRYPTLWRRTRRWVPGRKPGGRVSTGGPCSWWRRSGWCRGPRGATLSLYQRGKWRESNRPLLGNAPPNFFHYPVTLAIRLHGDSPTKVAPNNRAAIVESEQTIR